jgi:hypothetical protein
MEFRCVPLGAQAALGLRLPAVTAAAVRREFECGKDASEADGASQAAGMPTKGGVNAALLQSSSWSCTKNPTPTTTLVFAALTEVKASIWCAQD